MALTTVARGDRITYAHMQDLAAEARQKIGLKPYYFTPPVVWQVPDLATMLRFDLADWGDNPGGIVIRKDNRKVYQLHINGPRSWETQSNWHELTSANGWWVVGYLFGGIFEIPDYHEAITTLSGAGVGHIAVVIFTGARGIAGAPSASLAQPELWQLYQGSPSVLSNWRKLGGAQEVGGGTLGTVIGGISATRPGEPLWTKEMRAIQADAITKISDPTTGRVWRPYLYGQRQLSFVGSPTITAPITRLLEMHNLGAPMPFTGASRLDTNINRVRMYKDIDYYSRGVSEIEVQVSVQMAGNFKSPPSGFPGGVSLNFRILNAAEASPTSSRTLWGSLAGTPHTGIRPFIDDWSDSTGLGRRISEQSLAETQLYGNRPSIIWTPRRETIQDVQDGILNQIPVDWPGGQFDVYLQNLNNLEAGVDIATGLRWKLRVPVNEPINNSAHKSQVQIYKARMPEIAVEVNGYTTPLGTPLEVGNVIYRPISGDLAGAWVAKPAASVPIPHGSGLKYPFGIFSQSNTVAGVDRGFFTLAPYPCFRRPSGSIPASTAAQRWHIGEDEAGQATIFDVCVTRLSKTPGRLDYSGTLPLTVQIGVRQGSSFRRLFDVIVPANSGTGHADPDELAEAVIMDNEPLYYTPVTGVSVVQVLALKRTAKLTPLGINPPTWNFNGAQFGFSDSYNETVEFLNSIP